MEVISPEGEWKVRSVSRRCMYAERRPIPQPTSTDPTEIATKSPTTMGSIAQLKVLAPRALSTR